MTAPEYISNIVLPKVNTFKNVFLNLIFFSENYLKIKSTSVAVRSVICKYNTINFNCINIQTTLSETFSFNLSVPYNIDTD